MEKAMSRSQILITASFAALIALSARANGQTAAPAHPHVIVVKLIDKGGPMPYAFDPAIAVAERGDTVRFTNTVNVMHNVRFTKEAPGSKLGATMTGPYLMTKGQTYDVLIDGRFTDGTYAFVCDPHEAIGMKGTLIIKGVSVATGGK
jgi:plastocyanin